MNETEKQAIVAILALLEDIDPDRRRSFIESLLEGPLEEHPGQPIDFPGDPREPAIWPCCKQPYHPMRRLYVTQAEGRTQLLDLTEDHALHVGDTFATDAESISSSLTTCPHCGQMLALLAEYP